MQTSQALPITGDLVQKHLALLQLELKYVAHFFSEFKDSLIQPLVYRAWNEIYAGIEDEYKKISNEVTHISIKPAERLNEIKELHKKLDSLYFNFTQEVGEVVNEFEIAGCTKKEVQIILSNLSEVKTTLKPLLQNDERIYYMNSRLRHECNIPDNQSILERINSLYNAFSMLLRVFLVEENHQGFFLDFEDEISIARSQLAEDLHLLPYQKASYEFYTVLDEQLDNLRLLKKLAQVCPMKQLPISQDLYDYICSISRVTFHTEHVCEILDGRRLSDIEREVLRTPVVSPRLFNANQPANDVAEAVNTLTL